MFKIYTGSLLVVALLFLFGCNGEMGATEDIDSNESAQTLDVNSSETNNTIVRVSDYGYIPDCLRLPGKVGCQ